MDPGTNDDLIQQTCGFKIFQDIISIKKKKQIIRNRSQPHLLNYIDDVPIKTYIDMEFSI